MSTELIITVILGLIGYAIMGFAFLSKLGTGLAVLQTTITDLKENSNEKIDKLDKKQDKYNNFLERLIKCESSTSSAHKRMDDAGLGKKSEE